MEIVRTITDLQQCLRAKGTQEVGFVPTMGALHEGHLSLIAHSVSENDVTVASIFVNPTQFNDKSDLERYPRTPEADCRLLEQAGCDIAFLPSVEEMYPEPDTRLFDLGPVAEVMEGKYRPGHFNGVAQIVSKLFYAVQPKRAYFGDKDFQQIAVIRSMVRILDIPVEIEPCPIVREPSGLAKSSRNTLLTDFEKERAVAISQTLSQSKRLMEMGASVSEVKRFVEQTLSQDDLFNMDYYEIVADDTLQTVGNWDESEHITGCIAIYCGKIRLIDNVHYK